MVKTLQDYRSFWTLWLGCAGSPEGKTVFKIQKDWNITTNYLYHKEPGLGIPMKNAMEKEKAILFEGKKARAGFDWIQGYIMAGHKPPEPGKWSMNLLMIESWPIIEKFVKKRADVLFSQDSLKTLYGGIKGLSQLAPYIFDDIFTMTVISNIIPFCEKYKANLVSRILYTSLAMPPGRDLLGYYLMISKTLKNDSPFPQIIHDENLLLDILYPIK